MFPCLLKGSVWNSKAWLIRALLVCVYGILACFRASLTEAAAFQKVRCSRMTCLARLVAPVDL